MYIYLVIFTNVLLYEISIVCFFLPHFFMRKNTWDGANEFDKIHLNQSSQHLASMYGWVCSLENTSPAINDFTINKHIMVLNVKELQKKAFVKY